MDEFDLKMLHALQEDGRLTNQELADRIGLSPSQCSRRRVMLEKSGVVTGYHAAVSTRAVGLDVLVFMQVSLATQALDSGQAFAKLMRGVDEVQEVYALTGEADYLVKLVVPNLETLSRVINEVFLPHRSVGRVQSSVVLDRVKETARLPLRRPSHSDRKADIPAPRPSGRKTRTRS